MFKENIMKKIAGLALVGVLATPGVVNAATATWGSNPVAIAGECTVDGGDVATAAAQLEACTSGGSGKYDTGRGVVDVDFTTVEKVNITTDTTIDKNLAKAIDGIQLDIAFGTKLTITDGATLNLTGASKIIGAGTVEVKNGGKLNITSSEDIVSAVAITVDGSYLTVNKGSIGVLKVNGVSTVNVDKVTGLVTINGAGKADLTASKLEAGLTVDGTKEAIVTVKGGIAGTIKVKNPKADVRLANSDASITDTNYTAGIVRQKLADGTVKVMVKGAVTDIELEANDVLVINTANKAIAKNLNVTGNGKIDNQTGADITFKSINKVESVVVGKDAYDEKAYVVGNITQTPDDQEQPGNTTQTPDGDTTIDKNPATGDSIMSYVTLALTSVASLGLAVKKFLF